MRTHRKDEELVKYYNLLVKAQIFYILNNAYFVLLSGTDRSTVRFRENCKHGNAENLFNNLNWSSFSSIPLNKFYIHTLQNLKKMFKKKKKRKYFSLATTTQDIQQNGQTQVTGSIS